LGRQAIVITTLILKRNEFWSDAHPDYSVFDEGKDIGRIYFGVGSGGQRRWLWAITGWGSDMADTLDEAKAKLKVKYLSL